MSYDDPDDLVLTWPRPATAWFEATPVGNGRLGALVVGGDDRYTLLLNDSTVWSGTPDGPDDALAAVLRQGAGPDRLEQVRSAIRSGDHRTAESLLMSFEGRYSQEFLPYARLDIECGHHDASSYEGRTLDLDKSVVEERFTVEGRTVRRRSWASAPDGVLCVEMSVADGVVDAELTAGSPLREVERHCGQDGIRLGVEIPVDGAPLHEPDVVPPLTYADGAIRGYDPFAALSIAVASDGEVTARDGRLAVTGVSHLVLTVASATSAERYWAADADRSLSREELADLATRRARAALEIGAEGLLRRHVADVVPLLRAARLTVGHRRGGRVDVDKELLTSPDPALLATVLFQWGRYLLVASSRPSAGPPANLQGIWNTEIRPPWSSNYTLNINTEMNYWAAETTGLAETHLPLFDLIDRLSRTGRRVAESLYGCRGWVAHHNADMWGWSLPVGMGHGDPAWAIWQMGGVWLAHHIWDHYDFGRDEKFLATRGWPVLRGCAEFCLDWLVDSGDGALDTIPSTSPENHLLTADAETQAVSQSSTMDVALIRSLFEKTLAAAQVLRVEDALCAEIRAALPRLRPLATTRDGRLREWIDDYVDQDPHHRHTSHLVTVYPLGQIDSETTPGLAEAAARVLDARGTAGIGWSWAWRIALRARLGDGDIAAALLAEASRPLRTDPHRHAPVDGSVPGGLLPNLFSSHPPFQIDANLGFPAAITEMLVQSHGGVIRLLPALPRSWPDGSLSGVRCRGGLVASVVWTDGVLVSATLHRASGDATEPVRLSYLCRHREITVPLDTTVDVAVIFATAAAEATSC